MSDADTGSDARPAALRPKLVWAVLAFYLLTVGAAALGAALVLSGAVPTSPMQQAYLHHVSSLDWAAAVLQGLLSIAGAVALFRLRRIALPLFCGALAIATVQTLEHVLATDLAAAFSGPNAGGGVIGYAVLTAVCFYVWRLTARGRLG